MGPPNQHEGEKNVAAGWGWVQACVAVDLAPLAGQTPTGPGGDVAGKTAPHKSRRNNMTGGKPPGVSNIVKVGKNILAKFEGNIWRKVPVEMSPARR
jgi:hypothetical protein